jgi:acetyl-CoA C-acetyltransferase
MYLDPRTPVIVGAGQINDREYGSEPIDLMVRCSEAAIADTGAPGLRERIDAVRVVWGVWPYADPGRLVAERLGRPDARTTKTTTGGNQVYDLVVDTATQIAAGGLDVAVVCAAESMRTRRADHARGAASGYLPERDGAAPDDVLGSGQALSNTVEESIGVHHPPRFYAMAETALRHRLGEGVDEHLRRIAGLWSRASAVAAANPHAWLRGELSADEIMTTTDRNRPIAAPYPKLMTSNLNVDQGGAVVMCSVAAAEAAGVPRDRWVFPWSGAGAADHWYPTNRWAFDESPAMRFVGRDALALAGLAVDDCALIDLYSCFPVAVQVAQREMGVSPDREFTITGGLTFAAGPLNCYCILPLTRSVELLRAAPSSAPCSPATAATSPSTARSCCRPSRRPTASGRRTPRTPSTRSPPDPRPPSRPPPGRSRRTRSRSIGRCGRSGRSSPCSTTPAAAIGPTRPTTPRCASCSTPTAANAGSSSTSRPGTSPDRNPRDGTRRPWVRGPKPPADGAARP